MQAISLKLPESVLQASTEAAQSLGELSRDPRFMAEFEEWEASAVADGLADEEAEGWFSLPEDKSTP